MCCELITYLHKQDSNADPIPTGSIHGNSHTHLRGTVHMHKWRNTSVLITIDLHSGAQTSFQTMKEKRNKQVLEMNDICLETPFQCELNKHIKVINVIEQRARRLNFIFPVLPGVQCAGEEQPLFISVCWSAHHRGLQLRLGEGGVPFAQLCKSSCG